MVVEATEATEARHLGVDVDDVVHVEPAHVALDGEGPAVLHRVEEDGGDLVPDAHAPAALVGDEGEVRAHVPEDGVGRGLAARARAHHVAHVRQREALLLRQLHLRPIDTFSYVNILSYNNPVEQKD